MLLEAVITGAVSWGAGLTFTGFGEGGTCAVATTVSGGLTSGVLTSGAWFSVGAGFGDFAITASGFGKVGFLRMRRRGCGLTGAVFSNDFGAGVTAGAGKDVSVSSSAWQRPAATPDECA